MTTAEQMWGKKQGLKKTNLVTYGANDRLRIVFMATADTQYKGRLFYKDGGKWMGTFPEYCKEVK